MSRYSFLTSSIHHGKKVYMPYILMGYPDCDTSLCIAKTFIDCGVHGIEIGFPFRDPVADGSVIEKAGNIALDNGFSVDRGFETIGNIRSLSDEIPLTLMLYYNMVLARGIDRFFADCASAGIDGVLIPDMPPEQAHTVLPSAQAHGIELIFIVAPTTTVERLDLISPIAGGFIYVVTRMGLTGSVEHYSDQLHHLFSMIRSKIDLPLIAGFGISTPEQATKMISTGADGVITGSKIVEMTDRDIGEILSHTKAMISAL